MADEAAGQFEADGADFILSLECTRTHAYEVKPGKGSHVPHPPPGGWHVSEKTLEAESIWRLTMGNGLEAAFKTMVFRAVPKFRIPPQIFATAMLRAAVHIQLCALGNRAQVRDWLLREAHAVDCPLPRYLGLGDEDVDFWNTEDKKSDH